MRLSKLLPIALATSVLLPLSAYALEGIGPRVTVTGTVEKATVTEQQIFDEQGGEFVIGCDTITKSPEQKIQAFKFSNTNDI
jgi:hypothetical protein